LTDIEARKVGECVSFDLVSGGSFFIEVKLANENRLI